MSGLLIKQMVGLGFGLVAWQFALAAIPGWRFFSVQTVLIFAAFIMALIGDAFYEAARLNAWPWQAKLTPTDGEKT